MTCWDYGEQTMNEILLTSSYNTKFKTYKKTDKLVYAQCHGDLKLNLSAMVIVKALHTDYSIALSCIGKHQNGYWLCGSMFRDTVYW